MVKHEKASAGNPKVFSATCAKETFVAMHMGSPLAPDLLGRIYTVWQMLADSDEIELLLDDHGFISHVNE